MKLLTYALACAALLALGSAIINVFALGTGGYYFIGMCTGMGYTYVYDAIYK
jgi:hypothetical protein